MGRKKPDGKINFSFVCIYCGFKKTGLTDIQEIIDLTNHLIKQFKLSIKQI